MRVAAAQLAADVTHPPSAEPLVKAVRDAAARGARLVVLPELATSGYCFRDREEAWVAAETVDGPSVTLLRQVSRDLAVTVVCGLPLLDGATLYNAAVVVEDGELLGAYRKSHLWDREGELFAAGDQGPLVVETSCGVLGVLLCYDLEFPELVRMAAQAGAEIIAAPVNWPVTDHPSDQHAIEVVKAQAAAAYYGVYVVVADRCGTERGTRWVGGSCVVAPSGYLLAGPATAPGAPAAEGLLLADVDPAVTHDKSLGPRNHRFDDRREALYLGPISPRH